MKHAWPVLNPDLRHLFSHPELSPYLPVLLFPTAFVFFLSVYDYRRSHPPSLLLTPSLSMLLSCAPSLPPSLTESQILPGLIGPTKVCDFRTLKNNRNASCSSATGPPVFPQEITPSGWKKHTVCVFRVPLMYLCVCFLLYGACRVNIYLNQEVTFRQSLIQNEFAYHLNPLISRPFIQSSTHTIVWCINKFT